MTINKLANTVDTLTGTVVKLKGTVDNLTGTVYTLMGTVDSLASTVDRLAVSVKKSFDDIHETMEKRFSKLEHGQENILLRLDQHSYKVDVDHLKRRMDCDCAGFFC